MKINFQTLAAALMCALLAGCGAAATAPPAPTPAAQPQRTALPPQPTPPALAALAGRARACDAPVDTATNPAQPQPDESAGPAVVHYDDDSNTIELRKGAQATLAAVGRTIGRPDALRELAPGEWLLSANLRVEAGAALRIAAPEVRWLKLRSDGGGFVWLKAQGGQLEIAGACVTSWDAGRQGYDQNEKDGRSFVLARSGAHMSIHGADLRYLGYNGPESYGLAWRQGGTTGEIVDSFVSHNFYGIYSFEVNDLVIRGNEVYSSTMYGIDPHTASLRLVIEDNVAHDNGKHGIILAEECSDGVIRNNVAYDNLHHGIVIYQRSNNNLVEGNTAYGNGGHGINVNDSTNTTVRGNTVYDNLAAGIGVGQQAAASQVVGNRVFANRGDGVTLYSDVKDTLLRENTISDNARYGVYLKSAGGMRLEGNQVTGNAIGVYLNVAQPPEVSQDSNQIHGNREADISHSAAQPSPAPEEEP
ncbi:MAG: right-handed parallel beta-helix repeat-containing protein [Kouleothrix sp.]|nr:right-handed parallel beta-helix repeat-containing protein [Kouleothrix sp.]